MSIMGPRTARAAALRASGKTYAQIADEMGVTTGTIGTLLNAASRHVKGLVNSNGRPRGEPEDLGHNSWAEGEAHCPRCGLRGRHICTPTSAVEMLGRRGEPAYVRNKAT